jgi:hypothetical protein
MWFPVTKRPERSAAYFSAYPDKRSTVDPANLVSLIIAQRDQKFEKPRAMVGAGGAFDPKGFPVPFLLHLITGLPPQQIECDLETSRTPVPGDIIYRKGVATADLIEPLAEELSRACGFRVALTLGDVPHDVIVAQGEYKFRPTDELNSWIEIYGRTFVGVRKGSFSGGNFEAMLSSVGQYMEPKSLIVSDATNVPRHDISWHLNDPMGAKPADDDHNRDDVLKNLTK